MQSPRIAVLAFVLGGAACGDPPGHMGGLVEPAPAPGLPGWRDAQSLSVEEAVHRFQFVDSKTGLPPSSLTYCLARSPQTELLPWSDPPEALLHRFAGHQPPVKKLSSCHMDLRNLSGVTDVETGGRAVIFRVSPLLWESDTEVVVDGGYHASGLNGSGKTYRVRLQGGSWVVVDARWRWIS